MGYWDPLGTPAGMEVPMGLVGAGTSLGTGSPVGHRGTCEFWVPVGHRSTGTPWGHGGTRVYGDPRGAQGHFGDRAPSVAQGHL